MKIDLKLKGFNLLKFNCNKNIVVHPETCADMVQMSHDEDFSLTDWIKGTSSSIGDNLGDWITTNLGESVTIDANWNPNINNLDNNNSVSLGYIGGAVNNPVRVPYTTYSQIGLLGINSNSSFNVSNGVLGLNAASGNYYGGIKTGFVDIPAQNKYKVELDSNGKAYVNIGNAVSFSGTPTANCLTKFNSNGTITNGPVLGVGTTTYLRNDGTWHTPTDTTYEVAIADQDDQRNRGLLCVIANENVTDTACDTLAVVEDPSEIKTLVPIVYNGAEGVTGHGVVLESIVAAIAADTNLLRLLVSAIAKDDDPESGCVAILREALNN